MDASNKPESQQQQQQQHQQHVHMHEADADYNSSEYTHSNLDPSIGTGDQPNSSATAQSSADTNAATPPTTSGVHDESHSHAMEAVMQLAQAASQQQYDEQQTSPSSTHVQQHSEHGHVENPEVHHDSLPVNNAPESTGEKRGEKRRSSHNATGSSGRRASKAAKQDEQDVAAGGEHNLPFPESWSEGNIPAEIQKAYQQHLAQAQAQANLDSQAARSASPAHQDGSPTTSPAAPNASNSPPFKATRQLSTSKRAAQNRAAQRAFRERRDKYVKVLESKASRLEEAIRIASECKRRYTEALQTIDGLRQDNHTLRVALAALSGSTIDAAPPPMKADELIASLPDIPQATTDDEQLVLAAAAGAGAGAGAAGTSAGRQNLDSLSAVAAAAAEAKSATETLGRSSPTQPQHIDTQHALSVSPQPSVQDRHLEPSHPLPTSTVTSPPPVATSTSTSTSTTSTATAVNSDVALPPVPSTTTS